MPVAHSQFGGNGGINIPRTAALVERLLNEDATGIVALSCVRTYFLCEQPNPDNTVRAAARSNPERLLLVGAAQRRPSTNHGLARFGLCFFVFCSTGPNPFSNCVPG